MLQSINESIRIPILIYLHSSVSGANERSSVIYCIDEYVGYQLY